VTYRQFDRCDSAWISGISATGLIAALDIDPNATNGARTVSVDTNTEVATMTNGFAVTAGARPFLGEPRYRTAGQKGVAWRAPASTHICFRELQPQALAQELRSVIAFHVIQRPVRRDIPLS